MCINKTATFNIDLKIWSAILFSLVNIHDLSHENCVIIFEKIIIIVSIFKKCFIQYENLNTLIISYSDECIYINSNIFIIFWWVFDVLKTMEVQINEIELMYKPFG